METVEEGVSGYAPVFDNFSKQMAEGDVKVLKWKLAFGAHIYEHEGLKVTFKNAEGQCRTEVLAPDKVFFFYAEKEAKNEEFYSAVTVDESSPLLREAEQRECHFPTSPSLPAWLLSGLKFGAKCGAKPFLFMFTKLRFVAQFIKGAFSILNSFLKNRLRKTFAWLIKVLGGEPGAFEEKTEVEDPKNPPYIKELLHGFTSTSQKKLKESCEREKLNIKCYFEDLARWLGRNKEEIAAFTVVGTTYAAAAIAFGAPVIGVVAIFVICGSSAAKVMHDIKEEMQECHES